MNWFSAMHNSFSVLSARDAPTVLISVCGALIFSTSTRLARLVDRVRELSRAIEEFSREENTDFPGDCNVEFAPRIAIHARRGHVRGDGERNLRPPPRIWKSSQPSAILSLTASS
jgi:hypothetical protein